MNLADLQKKFVASLNHESNEFSTDKKFLIYKQSIQGALQKALREIYPVCEQLVGKDFFIQMINAYIKENFSYSPDLNNYGEQLNHFITHWQPANTLVYLADMASLEWAWHKIAVENTLLKSIYPIHEIWRVNQKDYHGDQSIILKENEKYYYLIWQHESEKRIDLLEESVWEKLFN